MSDPGTRRGGLPPGATELALALLRTADRRFHRLTGERLGVGEERAAEAVWLPRLVDPAWPQPAEPVLVPGGAVHADVTDEDGEAFHTLLGLLPDAGPEELAAAAQAWRLPVTPYREPGRATFPPQPGLGADSDPPHRRRPLRPGGLDGVRVLDLTSLWAGPLCTSLLADGGAVVTKVDPDCRPDGFRQRAELYRRLNGCKAIVDLDLRRAEDRERFEDLVRRADLLVHSFSRRVMANLGYGSSRLRALNPGLATVSIAAFPLGCAEQDWLAYGTGVHAASGLALVDGLPAPAPVAYPDPLAGLAAFAVSLSLLGGGLGGTGAGGHAEVSLAGVVGLLSRGDQPVGRPALATRQRLDAVRR